MLERLADEASVAALADDVVSTLRYEKAVTKGSQSATGDVNERVDPRDTDVRLVAGLGDTVWHSLLATPEVASGHDIDLGRDFVDAYEGDLCISPRYERLVEGVLGSTATGGTEFC